MSQETNVSRTRNYSEKLLTESAMRMQKTKLMRTTSIRDGDSHKTVLLIDIEFENILLWANTAIGIPSWTTKARYWLIAELGRKKYYCLQLWYLAA